MKIFTILVMLMCSSNKKIINTNNPSCKNCIYYMNNKLKYEKCKKFGEIDSLTGKINFYYLDQCRSDELRCGKDGIYFEENKKNKSN